MTDAFVQEELWRDANQEEEADFVKKEEIGIRVLRSPSWKYGDQDGNGRGTIIRSSERKPGWAKVHWDNGYEGSYRVGANGEYDLVHSEPEALLSVGTEVEILVDNEKETFHPSRRGC